MKHLIEAYEAMDPEVRNDIKVDNSDVSFKIQDGPIKEVGKNGCQASDMLDYVRALFESLNKAYPCNENELTIAHLKSAKHQQNLRTEDREKRAVEGLNQA
jgi:hypothetical protein